MLWPAKDPDEILDYAINWSARLVDDTIATSTWTVPDGIATTANTSTTTTTTIWLSGGTEGQRYRVLNRVTTTAGRTMDHTVTLPIKSR